MSTKKAYARRDLGLALTAKEADWLAYVLRYVDECYAGEYEDGCISAARRKELKMGKRLLKTLEKQLVAKAEAK